MSLIMISVSVGQLFALVTGYFMLENIETGNWRMLVVITTIPGMLAWFVGVYIIDDTARYLLVSG